MYSGKHGLKNCRFAFVLLIFHFISCTISAQVFKPSDYHLLKLPASINSGFEESKPIYYPESQSLYFIRSHHPDNKGGSTAGQDVWVTEFKSGVWTPPDNNLTFNDENSNWLIGYAAKKKPQFYFLQYLQIGQARYAEVFQSGDYQSWVKDRLPIGLKPIPVKSNYHDFFMHSSGKVLLISYQGLDAIGQEDLYICWQKTPGRWEGPVHLGPQINTAGFEISPFLSADGKKLYFASNGHPGLGSADIWVSEKIGNNWLTWAKPQQLGPMVNSEKFDAYFWLTENDEAFFVSNRDSDATDIYWLKHSHHDIKPANVTAKNTEDKEITTKNLVISRDIFFIYNDFRLTDRAREILNSLLDDLDEEKVYKIEIDAYTDQSGSNRYNQHLSQKRANQVQEFFKKRKIKRNLVIATGKGKNNEIDISPDLMRKATIKVFYNGFD